SGQRTVDCLLSKHEQASPTRNSVMLNASARQMFWKTLGAPMPEGDATTSALVQARASGRDEQTVDRALATALGVTIADDLTAYLPSARFIERVPISYARRHGM